eukprot:14226208-Alexandrium_andersonii.AAC.1
MLLNDPEEHTIAARVFRDIRQSSRAHIDKAFARNRLPLTIELIPPSLAERGYARMRKVIQHIGGRSAHQAGPILGVDQISPSNQPDSHHAGVPSRGGRHRVRRTRH